jgi:hypothetical protein
MITFLGGIVATLLALSYVAAEPPTPVLAPGCFGGTIGAPTSVDHLVAKVSPVLQQKLIDAKDDIVASAGGPVARTAVRVGFPVAVREVPTFTEHGCRAILDEFGSYSVADLIALLDSAAKTRETKAPAAARRLLTELRRAR